MFVFSKKLLNLSERESSTASPNLKNNPGVLYQNEKDSAELFKQYFYSKGVKCKNLSSNFPMERFLRAYEVMKDQFSCLTALLWQFLFYKNLDS